MFTNVHITLFITYKSYNTYILLQQWKLESSKPTKRNVSIECTIFDNNVMFYKYGRMGISTFLADRTFNLMYAYEKFPAT